MSEVTVEDILKPKHKCVVCETKLATIFEKCPYCNFQQGRWYNGKYRVEVVLKSKGNWRVKALEEIPLKIVPIIYYNYVSQKISYEVGEEFTTVPRLLWTYWGLCPFDPNQFCRKYAKICRKYGQKGNECGHLDFLIREGKVKDRRHPR